MTSGWISRLSAAFLLFGGLAFVFVPDLVLARLSPGFPEGALWLAQLLGAAWLGVAALDWQSRHQVIGGIFGRPVLSVNFALYWIGGASLLKAAMRAESPPETWLLTAPALLLALAYLWLMLRGPLPKDRGAGPGG